MDAVVRVIEWRHKLSDQERHAVCHEPGNEMHIATEPVQLSHGYGASLTARVGEGC
jgi:hypothetical protein